ncbi:XF1762 family protein [Streptomyces sp. SM12]|uniref:XF1762 family protein n=1 Tax=Streptomyces sp. SM12 TaxID=1071602 RepID=UPI0035B68729
MILHLVPVRAAEAAAFVTMWHRHLRPPTSQLFAVGVADDDQVLRGVAIVGRPVARHFDNGTTVEVTRCCTDGTTNACSMLYGACWRAASTLGYRRLITYTRGSEPGASLRGAGWHEVASRPARSGWSCPSRPRDRPTDHAMPRTLWEAA